MAAPGRIRELVVGAGFAEPEIEEISLRWTFTSQDDYRRFLTNLSGTLSCVLQALPPGVQARVQEHVYVAAEPFRSGEGYDFPAACLSAVTR